MVGFMGKSRETILWPWLRIRKSLDYFLIFEKREKQKREGNIGKWNFVRKGIILDVVVAIARWDKGIGGAAVQGYLWFVF